MGGILLLMAFLLCGVIVSEALFGHRSGLVRLWLGLCFGLMMMMWLPAAAAFLLNFSVAAQFVGLGMACLIAIFCVCRNSFFKKRASIPQFESKRKSFLGDMPLRMLLVLLIPTLLLSCYLQYTHTLRCVDGTLHVGQSTYGDLCLHLGLATSLRNAAFPADYSILPGATVGYPFLSDSMATSMLLMGSDLSTAFVLTGSLMMALVYTGFIIFAWELTKKKSAVILAFVLMFVNGGLGFLYTFDGVFQDASALKEVFTGFYKTPTNMPDLNLRWVNVICDMMVPQRTLLCGWSMLLPALFLLADAVQLRSRKRFALLGIWAGLMPMVHTHSFFALGLLSIGVMLHFIIYAERKMRMNTLICFLIYGCTALVLALPQLLTWTFPQTIGGGSLSIRFNWVNNQGNGQLIDGYFWFWIKNVGPVYLFMLPAALSMKKGSLLRALALGALIIYTVAEFIQFQPNPYDNNKLFYVAYMIMLPAVALYLKKLWERLRGIRGRALFAVLFIGASTLSGSLSIAREVVSDYQLFSAAEVEAAEYIEENLPEKAVFLTGDHHNNPVAALTGRYIVCGTGSYLYYHGVDYSAQRSAMIAMLSDPENNLELFDEYNVDYIYISNAERSNYAPDEDWFAENCTLIYSEDGIDIYDWDFGG